MTIDEALKQIKTILGDDGFLQTNGHACAVGTNVDGKPWTFGWRQTPEEAVQLAQRIMGDYQACSIPPDR